MLVRYANIHMRVVHKNALICVRGLKYRARLRGVLCNHPIQAGKDCYGLNHRASSIGSHVVPITRVCVNRVNISGWIKGGHLLIFQLVEVFQGGDDGGREQGDDERDGGKGFAKTHKVRQHTTTP